jgi:hypothetical protein
MVPCSDNPKKYCRVPGKTDICFKQKKGLTTSKVETDHDFELKGPTDIPSRIISFIAHTLIGRQIDSIKNKFINGRLDKAIRSKVSELPITGGAKAGLVPAKIVSRGQFLTVHYCIDYKDFSETVRHCIATAERDGKVLRSLASTKKAKHDAGNAILKKCMKDRLQDESQAVPVTMKKKRHSAPKRPKKVKRRVKRKKKKVKWKMDWSAMGDN